MSFSKKRHLLLVFSGVLFVSIASATDYNGTPSTYAALLPGLKAGDTLNLAAGTYPHLVVSGLSGTASAWITITGPATGAPAIIQGSACCNTVEIVNSSYVAIKNLRIDSLGVAGLFGLSAKDGTSNLVHHILVEGNTFVGQTGSQQTSGISTKTPTWGWIIRGNTITGAGTGLYLGNSDGTDPFIGGIIEDNLIQNTIGYNAQVKFQIPRPSVPGMPTGQSVTLIRNNVFIKNDQASPDGNRPNLLVGGFPTTGAGSTDWYEVYGNLFIHNPRESLFQASGRVTIHDNIFVDGQAAALRLQNQDLPLQIAYIYNNTVYSSQGGISFGTAATVDDAVTGNLVFGATPIGGPIAHSSNNTVDTLANAGLCVTTPSFTPGVMNFFPLIGKCQGPAIDLSKFAFDTDSGIDFNGASKTAATGSIAFRGAYAGQGINPGWPLQAAIKAALPSAPPVTAGVYRNGAWFVDWNGNNQWDATDAAHVFTFGVPGDVPVIGDWNGDGRLKAGVYRNGFWFVDWNGNNQWDATDAAHVIAFGLPGDLPVMGDWNGDGHLKVGVYRNGVWFVDWNGNNQWDATDAAHIFTFGMAGDLPVMGDWNGDGHLKAGVFRSGVWFVDWNGNNQWDATDAAHLFAFGLPGDLPVMGDWNGNGHLKAGVFRNGLWYVDWNGNDQWDPPDYAHVFFIGLPGDLPVMGSWNSGQQSTSNLFVSNLSFPMETITAIDPELRRQLSDMQRDVAEIESRPEVQDRMRRMKIEMERLREHLPRQ